MSSARTHRQLVNLVLFGAMLALSACSKEDLDGPHCADQEDGTSKSFTTMGEGAGSTSGGALTGGPDTTGEGDGRGISDDGDDLSDSEKGRKKKVN